MTVRLPNNQRVLQRVANSDALLFTGVGGSDEGDRPFLDCVFPMKKGEGGEWASEKSKRLWRCAEGRKVAPGARGS